MSRGDKNLSPETPAGNPAGNSASNPDEQDWQTLKKLWPLLWRFPGRVVIAMLLLVAAKLATVTLPLLLKYIVEAFEETPENLWVVPVGLVIAYGVMRTASVLFGELRDVVFAKVTERAMRTSALNVFQHLHRLDLSFHLGRRTGGLSRDIERGVSGISFLLRFMLFNIVPTFLEIALVAIILFTVFSPWFAAITLVAVVGYVSFSVIATNWRTRFVREANQLDSKANTRAVDALLNYETVKYFNNDEYEAERYDASLARWENALRKSRLSQAALNSGQALIIGIALTAMMLLAAHYVTDKTMSVGDLVAVNAYMIQLFVPLNFLGFVYREVKRSLADIGRMFGLLDRQTTITDQPSATALHTNGGNITFNNIQFAYDPARPILHDVSFSIPAGQKVAVVGPSGAGKSTLARLLFRFYEPQSGLISIDDQDITQVTQSSLRQAIGVVPQDTVLFNDTIGYNIGYGRPDASQDDIERAAALAHLDSFIEQLPDGYDTVVGERGLKLSGGEKQRIAIARTILKDPCMLIFDEATSSLDSASEQAILTALNAVAAARSTLVIAHRLSTIIDADNIIVLKQGKIAEQGTHHDLLAQQGVYAELWHLQQHQREQTQQPSEKNA